MGIKLDNRKYQWKDTDSSRAEYPYIENWVTANSKVIDLGCGNGSLLAFLKNKKNIKEYGIEISESGVSVCKKKGLNVRQGRIDEHLPDLGDNSFDLAICNVTLQMLMYPEVTLWEMKRIAKKQIISFPNFAFIINRFELLLKGRMPKKMLFGYNWYDTGHIHQFSICDFKDLIEKNSMKVKNEVQLGRILGLKDIFPNAFSNIAVYLLEK